MMDNRKSTYFVLGVLILLSVVFVFLKIKSGGNFSANGTLLLQESRATYLHSDGIFSFKYPKDFTFSPLVETDDVTKQEVETIIFRGKKEKDNFQITVSILDEKPVTIARVKKEMPNLIMEDAKEIEISGARGVLFFSVDSQTKFKTREIWFSRNSILYQISAYPELDAEMSEILETWKWNDSQ